MDRLEILAKEIYNEFMKTDEPVTIEEAREMAGMEISSKNERNYVNADKKPEKSDNLKKKVKVSEEKQALFDFLWEGLSNYYENCEILKQNKLICLKIGEKTFKIDIIENRK